MSTPLIAALEIGTSTTVCLVGEVGAADKIRVVGKGIYPSTGVHKGQIIDMQHAKSGVAMAVKQASDESRVDIGRVIMAVNGGGVEAVRNQAAVQVMARNRIVSDDDVDEVTERVKEYPIPDDRVLLHTISQNFTLDGQGGIVKPLGLQGAQLVLGMLLVHAKRGPVENLRSVAVAEDLDVEDMVFGGLCSALAVLNQEQKKSGAAVIDLGGGTTSYFAYAGNVVAAAGSIAVGGEHVTNDLSLAFNIPQARAEEIKVAHGRATISPDTGLKRLAIPNEYGKGDQSISLKAMHTVINARMSETLRIVRARLAEADVLPRLGAGIVFTGGGAEMEDICSLGRSIFGVPCSIGVPLISGPALEGVKSMSSLATAIGLLKYGALAQRETGAKGFFGRIFSR
ncbi:MAG: cell division protein FtsA [Kiritimatiellae bacterium]|nr:cell division protein FtsA [Kiritimatiellia bacterium]